MPIAVACSTWCIFGVQGSLSVAMQVKRPSWMLCVVVTSLPVMSLTEFDRGRAEQRGSKRAGGHRLWVQHLLGAALVVGARQRIASG